jgi:hypothetical protein
MPGYFVRIELRGNPAAENYTALHALMNSYGFCQSAPAQGRITPITLPHAMYFGQSAEQPANLASSLRTAIEARVWTSAVVLTIDWSAWGLSPAQ